MTVGLQVPRFPQHFSDQEVRCLPETLPADQWGDRCCGIACLRSLLAYYRQPVPAPGELLVAALEHGAWSTRGWVHAGLASLASRYGLVGAAEGGHDLNSLRRLTDEGTPVIVSCTFRFPEDGRRGGHLVVVSGVRSAGDAEVVDFVDPSRWGASHSSVSGHRFAASSTGRAIVLRLGAPAGERDRAPSAEPVAEEACQ